MGSENVKIAVLSDIHGNYIALQRCVEFALTGGIDTFIFLGDYLGELPWPQKTMEYLYDLQNKYNCYFLQGNRDQYWLNYRKDGENGWLKGNSASGALLYTYERLKKRDFEFFESMPIVKEIAFFELPLLTICHGSPDRVNERMETKNERVVEIIEKSNSSYILCGHTHIQREIRCEGKVAWNPGSVGVPLKSNGKTQFMILHGRENCWYSEFISLEYDVESLICEIKQSGLDEYAPYWSVITKCVLRGMEIDPGDVLDSAMELCVQQYGKCIWPQIPEECWEQAVNEVLR